MTTRIVTITLLLSGLMLQAQVNTDSLWQTWYNQARPDSVRLAALQSLAHDYAARNPDSARMLAGIQLAYAREKSLIRWEARALNVTGQTYRFQSDFFRALQHYEQSIALLEQAGDREYMATVYGNMGDVYRVQSNLPKAIDCIAKSLALAEETGNKKKAADAYVGMAIMYFDLPYSDDKMFEYLEKARSLYGALKNEHGLSLVYANLATIYFNQEQLDKALLYADSALNIQQKRGDLYGMATSLYNRAEINSNRGRFDDALADFNKVATYFEELGDLEGLADTYNGMGDMWQRQKRYDLAVEACGKGLHIARDLGSLTSIEAEACECLYKAYQQQGNYKKAMQYLEEFIVVHDSLQQDETARKLKQLEVERQLATDRLNREKESFQMEIAHQQAIRRKDRTLGLLAVAGLGILSAALAVWLRMVYFRKRSQALEIRSETLEKQQLINEIALLRSQVNPHFLFNSLSILSSLVHKNPDLSEQFIDQLSRSYRYILEQKEQTLVTLRTELEFIRSYAFLLKIRFENKFDLNVQLDETLFDRYKIAPLTLQLLVENAVKHNRMSVREPLIVTVYVEDDFLIVKNPFRPRPQDRFSTGTGLANIQQRYALLTERSVWAGERADEFVVKLPLIMA